MIPEWRSQMTAMKRVLAIFVTILMIISVVPVLSGTAYAADRYNIVIPADQTEIRPGEYMNKPIESVTFEPGSKLEIIGVNAFLGCTSLTDITIPASVKKIDNSAFAGSGLEEITFLKGSKLETIYDCAFSRCDNLSSITIPASTKTIGYQAFSFSGFQSIMFEKNSRLETIDKEAFFSCSGLEVLTIPASVKSIGELAFYDCQKLDHVHYFGTNEDWRRINKGNTYPNAHSVKHRITKATPETFGEEKAYCTICKKYIYDPAVIEKPEQFQLSAASYTYDDGEKTPDVTVTDSAGEVIDVANYDVTYSGNVDAGTATATVTFKGDYYAGSKDLTFTIARAPIADVSVGGVTSRTYNGKAQTQTPVVKSGDRILVNGTDYRLSYKSNKNAGTATMTITGIGNYTGTKSTTFTINKAANTLKIKAKTATIKGSTKGRKGTLKKTKTLGVTKVIKFTNKCQGAKTYVKKSGNKKITIAKKTGKVTVKKGLKKGTYKVKVKVKAAGNANYNASAWKAVTFTVKVR